MESFGFVWKIGSSLSFPTRYYIQEKFEAQRLGSFFRVELSLTANHNSFVTMATSRAYPTHH